MKEDLSKGKVIFLNWKIQYYKDINCVFTLPTKVRLVKTMAFPVVMHGCESGLQTVRKHLTEGFLCAVSFLS